MVLNSREETLLVRPFGDPGLGRSDRDQLLARTARVTARKAVDGRPFAGARSRGDRQWGGGQAERRRQKPAADRGDRRCRGVFARGEVIACLNPAGQAVARGLTNYSSSEARLIQRKPSGEIESILGYMLEPELIHRDNLVLL